MANKIPVKAIFDNAGNVTALSEYSVGDTLDISFGGTGSSSVSSARTSLDVPSNADLLSHTLDNSNPHVVTAQQVQAIPNTDLGQPNGVPTLDSGGKVPASQLPTTNLPKLYVVADATARLAIPNLINGDEAIQLDDGSHWIYDGTSWYLRPVTTIIFGSDYTEVESLPVSSTTINSNPGILKVSLATSILNAGRYLLSINYMFNHDNVSNDFIGRVIHNNDTGNPIFFHQQEPKDSAGSGSGGTNQKLVISFDKKLTLAPGSHQFDLYFSSSVAGKTSSIWEANLSFWRLT